jgi:hypothetical protein
MLSSERAPEAPDVGREVGRLADALFDAVERILAEGEAASISDDAAQKLMTAAVKLYQRKSLAEGRAFLPVVSPQALTPTEAVHAACELIRTVDLGPFDLALWFSRPRPDNAASGSSAP